jgi:tetratricopeptide (TPR) repeat protein
MTADFDAIQSLLKQAHGSATGVPSIESLKPAADPEAAAETLRAAIARFKEEVEADKNVLRRIKKYRKVGIYALTPGQWMAIGVSAPFLVVMAIYFFNLFSAVTRSNLAIRRGITLVYAHNPNAAIAEMEYALTLGAAEGVTRLRFGLALADMEYADSAVLFLDQATAIGRSQNDIGLTADAANRAAMIFLEANQLEAAQKRIDSVLSLDARQRDALIVQGKIRMAQSRFEDAEASFFSSIERNPNSLMPRYYLWQTYLRQGKLIQAREQEEYLLLARPAGDEDIETMTGYADLLAGAGHLREAEQVLLSILKIQRKPMPEIMISLGHLALENQDLPMARVYADSAVAIAPGHPSGYVLRGEIHYRDGDIREATRNFEKTLEINPRHEKALYNLGCVMLYDLNMPAAAREHLRRAEANGFSGTFLWFNIGASEYLLKRGAAALEAWDRMPGQLHENNDIRWAYANAALLDRQADTALRIFEVLRAARGENDPAIINNIGVAVEMRGDSRVALEHYWKAVRTSKTPEAADSIAQANIDRMLRNRRVDDVWSAMHTQIELRPRGAAGRPRGIRVTAP